MPLKTAVVGGGRIAPVHLSALDAHPDVDLRAVCDANESRAGNRASEYDVRAYGDFEGMLALESLDWIHLCTPVGTHADLARMALQDDLAIQIESPLTEGASSAEELSALAAEGGGRVSVVHAGGFEPVLVEATELIREGSIGGLRAVDLLSAGEPAPDATGGRDWLGTLPGGAFEERLVRPISQLLRLGGYPESVDAISANATRHRSYDGAFAFDGTSFQYTTADGVHCSGTVVAGDVRQRIVRIHGDRGRLLVDLERDAVTHEDRSPDGSGGTSAVDAADVAVTRLRGMAARLIEAARDPLDVDPGSTTPSEPRRVQIHEEVRALVDDEPLPVPLSEGVWAMHVLQAIRSAARTTDSILSVAPEMDAT